jgi:hypothetical protein
MWKNRYGTYDHLARVKEWSVGGDDEDEAGAVNERPAHHSRGGAAAADRGIGSRDVGLGCGHAGSARRMFSPSGDPPARRRRSGKNSLHHFTKPPPPTWPTGVDELRRWTALDDAELAAAIHRISDLDPDPALRARARRLFALALETRGLKVQTIHAFCTRLLHSFPFEAMSPRASTCSTTRRWRSC